MNIAKKFLKIIFIITIVVIFAFCIMFSIIPEGGNLIYSSNSPQDKYIINAYIHSTSLSSDAIRCEVIKNNSNISKNIYWNSPQDSVDIQWIDEETVDINGVVLNIKTDKYDFRWN